MRLCNRKNKLGQDAPVGSLCGLLWLIFKSLVRIFRALMRLPSPRAATSLRRTALVPPPPLPPPPPLSSSVGQEPATPRCESEHADDVVQVVARGAVDQDPGDRGDRVSQGSVSLREAWGRVGVGSRGWGSCRRTFSILNAPMPGNQYEIEFANYSI